MTIEKVAMKETMIKSDGSIEVRKWDSFQEDEIELGKSIDHREVFMPGEDVSNQDNEIKLIATAVHTKERIDVHRAKIQRNKGRGRSKLGKSDVNELDRPLDPESVRTPPE